MNTKKGAYIIFNISGGLGKNIMATAVVRALNMHYPDHKIIIATAHKDVWLSNPRIEKVINPMTEPDLYKTYIYKQKTRIYRLDPYHTKEHTYRSAHLTEIWCKLCNIPWQGVKPELYFTDREMSLVRKLLNVTKDTRPICMVQMSGGATNQPYPISWARDIPLPLATRIVSKMNAKGFRTIQLRRNDQIAIPGAEYIVMSHRQALAAISFSTLRLFMDSFAQHAAVAHELPSTVLWIANSPTVFGYPLHHNIVSKAEEQFRHVPDLYVDHADIIGRAEDCPYATNEIFDEIQILESFIS